ncbi:hypothetical protein Droror1_Dr00003593 [Drosera rotundifolia]
MRKGKSMKSRGGGGLLPSSLRIISSCIKTVSSNASTVVNGVRSAGATVAASISGPTSDDVKEQVTWSGFDKLEPGSSPSRHVLLLGYINGFQVIDVEDALNFSELVSKRDCGRVSFLQLQPLPLKSSNQEGFSKSHPLLLVVAGEVCGKGHTQSRGHVAGVGTDGFVESRGRDLVNGSMAIRFYSMKSHSYVHVLRFLSPVCMVRCSLAIVAVGLETQICCYDAVTLENRFSVLTYPVLHVIGQERFVNIGYGPMALGRRWLAYASNNPLIVNTSRLGPLNVTSPSISPSTSPGAGNLVARRAVESSKQLASGLVNLGDRGYRTISKYCQELLPESPTTPLLMRLDSAEAESAGVVVVKDCISRMVVSQFRAHSSPISALCFDPSGTLLVTASAHGNSINVFRIMPSFIRAGSGTRGHDWSSSYAHLYKLHRGLRAAVIQDICFSYSSQWVAIVSSKGTCHVFALSPFGGDVSFQNLNSEAKECLLTPIMTRPWWSTSNLSCNQQLSPPPAPVSLSVVGRIRDGNSGLLNTVTNAAAAVSRKVVGPSGALIAVFHNSMSSLRDGAPVVKIMEHLLVYTPSGHVVQHEIGPPLCSEQVDDCSSTQASFFEKLHDTELSINIRPVQWWYVCRRSDWPEREEQIPEMIPHKNEKVVFRSDGLNYSIPGESFFETKNEHLKSGLSRTDSLRLQEKSNSYLSSAEVQYNSGREPLWDNSKVSFHVMRPPRCYSNEGGDVEIEEFTSLEVEIRRGDLVPALDSFRGFEPVWKDRGQYYPSSSRSEAHCSTDTRPEVTVICHSKPSSFSSTESCDGGSTRHIEHLMGLDDIGAEKAYMPIHRTASGSFHDMREALDELLDKRLVSSKSFLREQQRSGIDVETACVAGYVLEPESKSLASGSNVLDCHQNLLDAFRGATQPGNARTWNLSKISSGNTKASSYVDDEILPPARHDAADFGPSDKNAYHIGSEPYSFSGQNEASDNAEASSTTKCGKDDEEEDMLGCMFGFSEEGKTSDNAEASSTAKCGNDDDDEDMLGCMFGFSEEG